MFYPDIEKYKELCRSSKIVPVSYEREADTETPISLFKKFSNDKYSYLLESVEGGERWARYSFMGRKPLLIFKAKEDNVVIEKEGRQKLYRENPLTVLENLLNDLKGNSFYHLPRFYGGVVGYFSYDMIRNIENIKSYGEDDILTPDCHLMVPEEVIVFDHLKQKTHIIINTFSNLGSDGYNNSKERIKQIIEELSAKDISEEIETSDIMECDRKFSSSVSKDDFCRKVVKIKEHIKKGDIFQAVLSQRLKTKFNGHPFDVYRKLRLLNPSPYMYYFKFDNYSVVGASPEMLVRVEDDIIETCPIAGTRPRGGNCNKDNDLANELQNDEKEKAEHIMLVDLGRNDIGKVAKFGTVKVNNLMHIEKYSHVMHMVTNLTGVLRKDESPVNVIKAVLPAGTVSGAPKIRAMEIIDELEKKKRGIYAGAIGYIGFDGNIDTCIAIRTAIFKNDYVYVQAGAGIVADSVPEKEYEETLNKAQALIAAIRKVGE